MGSKTTACIVTLIIAGLLGLAAFLGASEGKKLNAQNKERRAKTERERQDYILASYVADTNNNWCTSPDEWSAVYRDVHGEELHFDSLNPWRPTPDDIAKYLEMHPERAAQVKRERYHEGY